MIQAQEIQTFAFSQLNIQYLETQLLDDSLKRPNDPHKNQW